MQITSQEVEQRLIEQGNSEIAASSLRFFKTGKGTYGEGDRFLGVRMPVLRQQVPRLREMPDSEVLALLRSDWHEVRMLALLLMVDRARRTKRDAVRGDLYRQYLDHTRYVNNWDLVDTSAPQLVGGYLLHHDRSPLMTLADSTFLWHRRIALLATFAFIRQGQFADTLTLSAHLLSDPEDLIHKAAGWMLREVGNRDQGVLKGFLTQHASIMPRTQLRYAIEKLPQTERQIYLRA